VARQNDVWLKAQDMRWDNLGMVTGINNSSEVSGGFDAFRSKSIGKYGKAALSEYNNNENWPWVLKDPRLCLTFTKWLPFLEGASPPILFTYRNPLDAARSLFERKRNSVPLLDGLKLWIWYNRESLRLSAGMCRVITSNDALLKNPKKEVVRIQEELSGCGLKLGSFNSSIVESFINTDFQHGGVIQSDETCNIPPYESSTSNTATLAAEQDVYEKSMKIFCDMETGKTFSTIYVWPILL